MRARISEELTLLRKYYPNIEHAEKEGEDWFRLPHFRLPPGFRINADNVDEIPIVFPVKADFPGSSPYGFLVPAGLNSGGNSLGNSGAPPKQPPFSGQWLHLSWTCEDWRGTNDVHTGANLVYWARSFTARFKEGA